MDYDKKFCKSKVILIVWIIFANENEQICYY